MTKRKNKFDLSHFIHEGTLKDGQTLFYVSDPSKTCKINKQPNGEFKVILGKEVMTIHAFAQRCLGQDPPDHATKWIRTENGETLYEIWHNESAFEDAA